MKALKWLTCLMLSCVITVTTVSAFDLGNNASFLTGVIFGLVAGVAAIVWCEQK